jgi:hypothetical protein
VDQAKRQRIRDGRGEPADQQRDEDVDPEIEEHGELATQCQEFERFELTRGLSEGLRDHRGVESGPEEASDPMREDMDGKGRHWIRDPGRHDRDGAVPVGQGGEPQREDRLETHGRRERNDHADRNTARDGFGRTSKLGQPGRDPCVQCAPDRLGRLVLRCFARHTFEACDTAEVHRA